MKGTRYLLTRLDDTTGNIISAHHYTLKNLWFKLVLGVRIGSREQLLGVLPLLIKWAIPVGSHGGLAVEP